MKYKLAVVELIIKQCIRAVNSLILAPGGEEVGRNVVAALVDEGAGVLPVHQSNPIITQNDHDEV